MARAFWIWLGLLTLLACGGGVYVLSVKSAEGINAFGVFGSILTVVGTSVAIAQVFELRRRAEAIEQEVKNARKDFFRFEHSTVMASCIARLHLVIELNTQNRFEACSTELKYVVEELVKIGPDATELFGDRSREFSSCLRSAQEARAAAVKLKTGVDDHSGTRERVDQVSNELIALLGHALSKIRSK